MEKVVLDGSLTLTILPLGESYFTLNNDDLTWFTEELSPLEAGSVDDRYGVVLHYGRVRITIERLEDDSN